MFPMHTNQKIIRRSTGIIKDCTKCPRLMTNALLQLVRDIINGVCYQRYEKRLEKRKGRLNVNICEKKIWMSNYN